MLPENANREDVGTISTQMNTAARNLGIAIVGGHCEITPHLTQPIVVGCTMGLTEKENYVTARGAKPGDKLILTKSVGIEGTAILATDREEELKTIIDHQTLRNGKKYYDQISVVKDAITAFKTGGVDAMHDPTEGGVMGGIYEIANASNIGVKVFEEEIPVMPETQKICSFYKIDPLQLISSGALLISATSRCTEKIIRSLGKKHIPASIIGEFLKDPQDRKIIRKNGEAQILPEPSSDHLWLALLRK
jgi:hydrogenase maturation factor